MRYLTALVVALMTAYLPVVGEAAHLQRTPPATRPATKPAHAPPPLKPDLKWPTLQQYEKEIGEAGVLLQNDHLLLFAPANKAKEARIIFTYLVRAYAELHAIVGEPTKYKIVVYHLPRGWGGTSECVIEYDYSNLDFEKHEEWRRHRVPHVSGYIEEMAHNFVSTTKAQFGWEMVGWSLGVKVCEKVAPNAVFARQVENTRTQQAQTFERYRALNFTFPPDVEANLCDRIHAHLLWQCDQRYGQRFWTDFFTEIRKVRKELDDAVHLAGGDNIRNKRYELTVNCFDRLRGIGFKRLLKSNQISTTVDAKSLHPTDAGWNRKFIPGD